MSAWAALRWPERPLLSLGCMVAPTPDAAALWAKRGGQRGLACRFTLAHLGSFRGRSEWLCWGRVLSAFPFTALQLCLLLCFGSLFSLLPATAAVDLLIFSPLQLVL